MRNHKYTHKEDSIIVKEVHECPQNLNEAFYRASKQINRTLNAIQFRWYTKLKREQNKFTLKGNPHFSNIKNMSHQHVSNNNPKKFLNKHVHSNAPDLKTVDAFFVDLIPKSKKKEIAAREMYELYTEYCTVKNLQPLGQAKFWQIISQYPLRYNLTKKHNGGGVHYVLNSVPENLATSDKINSMKKENTNPDLMGAARHLINKLSSEQRNRLVIEEIFKL